MTVAPPASSADPRPVVTDGPGGSVVAGRRCVACAHPSAMAVPRCSRCGAATEQASFGPGGVVWSITTIHVPSGEREAPYTLAYVDLDDGPRLLAHVHDGGAPPQVGGLVRLLGRTALGDPEVGAVE